MLPKLIHDDFKNRLSLTPERQFTSSETSKQNDSQIKHHDGKVCYNITCQHFRLSTNCDLVIKRIFDTCALIKFDAFDDFARRTNSCSIFLEIVLWSSKTSTKLSNVLSVR